jgi:hypothetical protein
LYLKFVADLIKINHSEIFPSTFPTFVSATSAFSPHHLKILFFLLYYKFKNLKFNFFYFKKMENGGFRGWLSALGRGGGWRRFWGGSLPPPLAEDGRAPPPATTLA